MLLRVLRGPHAGATLDVLALASRASAPTKRKTIEDEDFIHITIGRGKRNELSLHRDASVSTTHCVAKFARDGTRALVQELGSSNGTLLGRLENNEWRAILEAKDHVAEWNPGEEMEVGDSVLAWQSAADAPVFAPVAQASVSNALSHFRSPTHTHFTREKRRAVTSVARSVGRFDGRGTPSTDLIPVKDAMQATLVMSVARPHTMAQTKRTRRVRSKSPSYSDEDGARSELAVRFNLEADEEEPRDADGDDAPRRPKVCARVGLGVLIGVILACLAPYALESLGFVAARAVRLISRASAAETLEATVIRASVEGSARPLSARVARRLWRSLMPSQDPADETESWFMDHSAASETVSIASATYPFRLNLAQAATGVNAEDCWWLPPPAARGSVWVRLPTRPGEIRVYKHESAVASKMTPKSLRVSTSSCENESCVLGVMELTDVPGYQSLRLLPPPDARAGDAVELRLDAFGRSGAAEGACLHGVFFLP